MKFLGNSASEDYKSKLEDLIEIMKISGFLTDSNVESAIKKVLRHNFVPKNQQNIAYDNSPIPIFENQTISQPSVVARMTEWLDVKENQKILEIGSGSGWQSAILSILVSRGKILTIERHKKLADFAKANLEKMGIKNVTIIHGDGNLGLPEEAPFDRIMITAACKTIPPTLLEQLKIGGLLIAPVGEKTQSLILLKKTPEGFEELKNQEGYIFVPLI
jgi:protein-L-isoaspartate(D-aspartate) O-methyltransferase